MQSDQIVQSLQNFQAFEQLAAIVQLNWNGNHACIYLKLIDNP